VLAIKCRAGLDYDSVLRGERINPCRARSNQLITRSIAISAILALLLLCFQQVVPTKAYGQPTTGLPGIVHTINLGEVSLVSVQNIGGSNISSIVLNSTEQNIDFIHIRGIGIQNVNSTSAILNFNEPLKPGDSLGIFVAWHDAITNNKTEIVAPIFWIGDKLHYDPNIVEQTHFAVYASERPISTLEVSPVAVEASSPPQDFNKIDPSKEPDVANQLLIAANLTGPSNPEDWLGAKYATCWYYTTLSGDAGAIDAHDSCEAKYDYD
jgi:hypothetical protein